MAIVRFIRVLAGCAHLGWTMSALQLCKPRSRAGSVVDGLVKAYDKTICETDSVGGPLSTSYEDGARTISVSHLPESGSL